jgi:raffinose/stachyose/melibiose transport system substrate-binding protein
MKVLVAVALLSALTLSACGNSTPTKTTASKASDAPVVLTLWHNLGTTQNAVAAKALTDAYTKLHPNVTFKLVAQPGDNYFALLTAASISKTGPDLALIWTGLFIFKNLGFLTNLKDKIPASDLARVEYLEWSAKDFNLSNGPTVIPTDRQFYIGFYNKAAFTKAGVSSVPTNWNELYTACSKLKAAGYTPITYGNGGQSLGALYYPWYDASYMAIGQYPTNTFLDLYSGKNPWNSAANIDSYTKYAALKTKGCVNSDVLTKTNNLDDFTSGKAAMIIDGTWDTQKFTDAMGTNVAAFIPPFSDKAINGVVETSGQGYAVTNYSKNSAAALGFLDFMTTAAAAKVVDGTGLIPALKGSKTSNPVNQQMLDFTTQAGITSYQMLDNVLQGDLVDAGNKIIPSILAGVTSPTAALKQMRQVWAQLPAAQRSGQYK